MKDRQFLLALFACAFVYSFLASIFIRDAIIPTVYTQSVDGHLPSDPYTYHRLAEKNADIFRQGGSAYSFSPDGQRIAGIISAIYVLGGSVYLIVFLNCLLHGASVVTLFLILRHWFSAVGSTVGIIPLLISPYMMLWFSQINKESYTLFGVLLFMYGFIKFLSLNRFFSCKAFLVFIQMIIGSLFIWLIRPYVNHLLLPSVVLIIMAAFFYYKNNRWTRLFFGIGVITLFGVISFSGSSGQSSYQTVAQAINGPQKVTVQHTTTADECFKKIVNWQNAKFLPAFVNNRLRGLMEQRCRIFTILDVDKNLTVINSFFTVDWLPSSSLEVIHHIPISFAYGIAFPWPWDVLSIVQPTFSIFYLCVIFESYLLYFGLLGLFLWMVRNRQLSLLVPILCSASVMTAFAMAVPFLGALYRYRYPWWILLIGLGLAALSDLRNREEKVRHRT